METIVANTVLKPQSENLFRERIIPSKKKVLVHSKSDKKEVWTDEAEQTISSVEDLTELKPLTDKCVLQCLEVRYLTDNICSKAGITLIVVNPFKCIPGLYGPIQLKKYHEGDCKELPPHIFATTDNAYSAMRLGLGQMNQSVIVSGESGSGKTWTTRCLMKYLTSLAEFNPSGFSPSPVHCIEKRILDSNPILEAFGNATTQRNHNSSRFGKYIKLQFDRSGFIIGASIQTYLLEKTRVVHQGQKEKNFHIFYQMLESASEEERVSWRLPLYDSTQHQSFSFLPRAAVSFTESSLRETREAMKSVGINSKQEDKIFKILAAILHLGNIAFTQDEDDDACDVDESASVQESLEVSCSLLGIEEEAFSKYMLLRRIAAHHGKRKSVFMKPCERAEACNRRDCVAKVVYSRLFDWLVSFLNKHTTTKHSSAFIGLLDIYGFENFSFNSLEQLCINYANEKLQQHFVSHFLKAEQDEYMKEELAWDFCQFNDNQPCLDALEGKISVFSLLNEECKLNRSSNPSALRERIISCISNPFISNKSKGSKQSLGFIVRHFADEVEYAVDGLTEKNKDGIPPELTEILASSKNLFIRTLVHEDILAQKKLTSANAKVPVKTVISKFKNSLDDLMVTLRNTTPHYIRCIKPNQTCTPGVFNSSLVASQLSACGVMATLAVSRAGYPYKISYREFLGRYGLILPNLQLPPKDICQIILEQIFGLDDKENKPPGQRSPYKIGRSKVFLHDEQLEHLERERKQVLSNKAICIQRCWRRFRLEREMRQMAAVTIQAGFRGWRARLEIQRMNEAARIIQHALLNYLIRKEQEKIDADLEKEAREMENDDTWNQTDCEEETGDVPLLLPNRPLYPLATRAHVQCRQLPLFSSVFGQYSSLEFSPRPPMGCLEDELDGAVSSDHHDNWMNDIDEDVEDDEISIDDATGIIKGTNVADDDDINEEGEAEGARPSKLDFIRNRTAELAIGAVMVGLLLRGPLKL